MFGGSFYGQSGYAQAPTQQGNRIFQVSLSATANTVASFIKSVGKFVNTLGIAASSLTRQTGKFLNGTIVPSASMNNSAGKIVSVQVSSTPSFIKSVAHSIYSVSAVAVLLIKSASKNLGATAISTTSMQNGAGKIVVTQVSNQASFGNFSIAKFITAIVTSSASVSKSVAKLLSIANTAVVSLTKSIGKRLAVSDITVVSVLKGIGLSLAASSSAALFLQLQTGKVIFAIGIGVPDLSTGRQAVVVLMAVTTIAIALISKSVGKQLSASAGHAVLLLKQMVEQFIASVSETALLTKQAGKYILSSVLGNISLPKRVGKGLSLSEVVIPFVLKNLLESLVATSGSVTTQVRMVGKRILAQSAGASGLNSGVGKNISLGIVVLPVIGKSINKLLATARSVIATLSAAKDRLSKGGKAHVSDSPRHIASTGEYGK